MAQTASSYSAYSYAESILIRIRSTSVWSRYIQFLTWFRRINILRITIRTVSFIAAFFEAGILFIVASSVFLIFMPIASLLYFGIYLAALIKRRRVNRYMASILQDKRVFVFFADRDTDLSESSFFSGLCRNCAKANSCAVVIVSPFFFSSEGVGKKRPYVTVRKEEDDLYICRRMNFFSLRRAVLSKLDTIYFF